MYEVRPLTELAPIRSPAVSATGFGGVLTSVHPGVPNAAFAPDGAPPITRPRPYTSYDMPVDLGPLAAGRTGAADGFEPIDGNERVDGVPRARLHTPAQVLALFLTA